MTRTTKALALTLTAAVLQATSAYAAISYKYATDLSSLTLAAGQAGSVNLYLVETTTDSTPSRFVTESGLFGSYFDVTYLPDPTPLPTPSSISSVLANTVDFNDPAGPETFTSPTFAYVRQSTDILAPTGPMGAVLSPGVRQVFLGSVTVVGGSSVGTTTFRVADDPRSNDTLTFDAQTSPLDPLIAPTSFTVTTLVPEPASILAACGLALPLLRPRRHAR